MNYSDNRFSFAFADAVVLRETLGDLRLGRVSIDSTPALSLRREGEVTYLDFVLAAPAEVFVDNTLTDGSADPVTGGAIKAYVDAQFSLRGRGARLEMTAADTAPTLLENRFYVFPTMAALQIRLATPADSGLTNEYHFRFTSGSTPTVLTLPTGVVGAFTPEAGRVYEVSIVDGYLSYRDWEV